MEKNRANNLAGILTQQENEILEDWMALQQASSVRRADLISDVDLRRESREFLSAFRQGVASSAGDISSPTWDTARGLVAEIVRSRARQGFTPSETATFIFSLKQHRNLPEDPGRDHQPATARTSGAVHPGGQTVGWRSGAAADRHSR